MNVRPVFLLSLAASLLLASPANCQTADISQSSLLAKGTMAPNFTVHDPRGNRVSLSNYRGRVVVLDFWATWCDQCPESLAATNLVAATYAKMNVVVLAVNAGDSSNAVKSWLAGHKRLNSIQFAIDPTGDNKNVATSLYHVTVMPSQFVIDRRGKIVKSIEGYPGDDSLLVAGIKTALRKH